MSFAGFYREEAWRRCQMRAVDDGRTFGPWTGAAFPNCSLPALERVHLRLYAFFTHGRTIAEPDEGAATVFESGADMARFRTDYASGSTRDEARRDWEAALAADDTRAIPTVVVGPRRLVGLTELGEYRKAAAAASG